MWNEGLSLNNTASYHISERETAKAAYNLDVHSTADHDST